MNPGLKCPALSILLFLCSFHFCVVGGLLFPCLLLQVGSRSFCLSYLHLILALVSFIYSNIFSFHLHSISKLISWVQTFPQSLILIYSTFYWSSPPQFTFDTLSHHFQANFTIFPPTLISPEFSILLSTLLLRCKTWNTSLISFLPFISHQDWFIFSHNCFFFLNSPCLLVIPTITSLS